MSVNSKEMNSEMTHFPFQIATCGYFQQWLQVTMQTVFHLCLSNVGGNDDKTDDTDDFCTRVVIGGFANSIGGGEVWYHFLDGSVHCGNVIVCVSTPDSCWVGLDIKDYMSIGEKRRRKEIRWYSLYSVGPCAFLLLYTDILVTRNGFAWNVPTFLQNPGVPTVPFEL